MIKQFDLVIFIGRFGPFHNVHKTIIDYGLKISHQVLVLIGSSDSPITLRNPFTFIDRKRMIYGSYASPIKNRIIIEPLKDFTYNMPAWIGEVQKIVYKYNNNLSRIGIIGCNKDNTSYYLKSFPQWTRIPIETKLYNDIPLSATLIRDYIFFNKHTLDLKSLPIPAGTIKFLNWYCNKNNYNYTNLIEERKAIKQLNDIYGKGPHQTVDSLVYQSGHILLVTRNNRPGRHYLALPGGYVDTNQTLFDEALRELFEETKLKVPKPVLEGSFKFSQTFDDPHRSDVGRIITHAHLFMLNDSKPLPKVKGSDDAFDAAWYPVGNLKESELYEDHFHIIWKLLSMAIL